MRGGRVSLKTAEGEALIVAESGNTLMITDQKGNTARVTIPDVYQSNDVIMVTDKVLMGLDGKTKAAVWRFEKENCNPITNR